jgi:hypothetical protein
VRRVDRLDPGSYESEISPWSRRPIEQASCESERGRGVPYVVWLVLPSWAEPLAWFSQGFVFLSRLNVGTPGLGTQQ